MRAAPGQKRRRDVTGDLRAGLMLGYWTAEPADHLDLVLRAEEVGFSSIWTAEAYGSDVVSPLAWWGAHTSRIELCTGLMQLSARTPACTAMTAVTMDHLSGGRFSLGLGVSGPQVVEGWYGQPFPKPLARTREYVGILRDIWAREAPVESDGPHYPCRTRVAPTSASRSRSPRTRGVRTSPSCSAPRGRRTSRWRPRSPTGGCRSSTRPNAARRCTPSRSRVPPTVSASPAP
jgi:alkanesulfonate monooxygenase SsuD/methylene tetrahydromethanopterin reductase-like flavin-dependent oxidoreductase (luciferase family)